MRKIKNSVLAAALCITCGLQAQITNFCGTTEAANTFFRENPHLKVKYEELKAKMESPEVQFYNKSYSQIQAVPSITIPIVFHILHTGGGENISDAQVMDAVSILSRDFQKLNADTTLVVNPFKTIIGKPNIEFRLAQLDPSGNCTNGIIRHYDTKTDWQSSNFSYYTYTWPRNKYLNVYVVKTISSGAAGYTFLPGTPIPSSADCIVILSGYVGSIGTGNVGTSRALTHEVGHWLNLDHVWGGNNNPGVACGDDGVGDTPITKGFSSCSLNNSDVCTPGTPENLQNYMDYSYCSRMFTMGQATRMQAALSSTVSGRNNLSSPGNLALTGITAPATNCIPMLEIKANPSTTLCSGNLLSMVSFTSNAVVTSYSWSATNGAVVTTPTAAGTSINFPTPGTSTVTCVASNTNGSVSASTVITVLNGATNYTVANSESFEAPGLPSSWNIVNANNNSVTWEQTTLGASEGSNSYYINNPANVANQIDYLYTPTYDFANNPSFGFTFKYAYARQSTSNNDVFKVQASSNCGGSWTDIYVPSANALAAASAGVSNIPLIPTADQWKLYNLTEHPNFTSFLTLPSVALRFYFQEDPGGQGFGNRIYLDEINFDVPAGINEFTRQIGLQVYPNPSNGSFNIKFTLSDAGKMKYDIVNVTGSIVQEQKEVAYGTGTHEVKVNHNLAAGIYFVNMEFNGIKAVKKLVVE